MHGVGFASVLLCVCLIWSQGTSGLEDWEIQLSDNMGQLNVSFASNNETAQAHFMLALKCLNTFWYDLAEEEFQVAQQLDPYFPMAYWGEAMCKKMFLWSYEDPVAASTILDKIQQNNIIPTGIQAMYVEAANALFASGVPLKDRNMNFAQHMAYMYEMYPYDDMVGSLYALSLMEIADGNQTIYEEARSILSAILERIPDQPAAMHYILHAYDFPDLAIAARGIPYAERFPQIVTDGPHADHMPAHIFIRFGMWKDAVTADRVALESIVNFSKERKDGSLTYDQGNRYHSLEYLQYYLLQLARFKEANGYLESMRDTIQQVDNTFFRQTYYRMAARQYLESRNYDIPAYASMELEPPAYQPLTEDLFWSSYSEAAFLFVRALQAISMKVDNAAMVVDEAYHRISQLVNLTMEEDPTWSYVTKDLDMTLHLLLAEQAYSATNVSDKRAAYAHAQQAVDIQDTMVLIASSPTLLFIPSWEFYGDLIIRAQDATNAPKAIELYTKALEMRPNRAGALRGLAAAYDLAGDSAKAAEWYQRVNVIWDDPDTEFDILDQVRAGAKMSTPEPPSGASGLHAGAIYVALLSAIAGVVLW